MGPGSYYIVAVPKNRKWMSELVLSFQITAPALDLTAGRLEYQPLPSELSVKPDGNPVFP